MPAVCYRLISSNLIVIAGIARSPKITSAHGVSANVAHAHHDNNRNVFGEWVFICQGANPFTIRRCICLIEKGKQVKNILSHLFPHLHPTLRTSTLEIFSQIMYGIMYAVLYCSHRTAFCFCNLSKSHAF